MITITASSPRYRRDDSDSEFIVLSHVVDCTNETGSVSVLYTSAEDHEVLFVRDLKDFENHFKLIKPLPVVDLAEEVNETIKFISSLPGSLADKNTLAKIKFYIGFVQQKIALQSQYNSRLYEKELQEMHEELLQLELYEQQLNNLLAGTPNES